jgi:hypothetical protein
MKYFPDDNPEGAEARWVIEEVYYVGKCYSCMVLWYVLNAV